MFTSRTARPIPRASSRDRRDIIWWRLVARNAAVVATQRVRVRASAHGWSEEAGQCTPAPPAPTRAGTRASRRMRAALHVLAVADQHDEDAPPGVVHVPCDAIAAGDAQPV